MCTQETSEDGASKPAAGEADDVRQAGAPSAPELFEGASPVTGNASWATALSGQQQAKDDAESVVLVDDEDTDGARTKEEEMLRLEHEEQEMKAAPPARGGECRAAITKMCRQVQETPKDEAPEPAVGKAGGGGAPITEGRQAEAPEPQAEAQAAPPAQGQDECISTKDFKPTKRHFKIMIAGESGLGKSTARQCLIHGLRMQDSGEWPSKRENPPKTLTIETSDPIQLKTDDPRREQIHLRFVDTPGYGDHMDISKDIGKVMEYIEEQYDKLRKDHHLNRKTRAEYHDSIVTCCLYFIAPHRCKENDIAFMKEISKKLPIVPVLAKADTMTDTETEDFRKEVSNKLKEDGISLYEFGRDDVPPFTLIADSNMKERTYKWGTAEMGNPEHCNFRLLKDLVIKKHLENMHAQAFDHWDEYCKERDGNGSPGDVKRNDKNRIQDSIAYAQDLAAKYWMRIIIFCIICIFIMAVRLYYLNSQVSSLKAQVNSLSAENRDLNTDFFKREALQQDLASKNISALLSSCHQDKEKLRNDYSACNEQRKKCLFPNCGWHPV